MNYLHEVIKRENLPAQFMDIVENCYAPIKTELLDYINPEQCLVLGVQGCQGSGKSTLSLFLKAMLENEPQLTTAVLSIDDFYLTLTERKRLATTIHPLLQTRGVPGTHDVNLALDTIRSLKQLSEGEELAIPRFDKAADDRALRSSWDKVQGKIQVIIFEGWCVGLQAQPEHALMNPVNQLEIDDDPKGIWRKYVNDKLHNEYKTLFAEIEKLIVLKAPSFACVYQWRLLQEQKLAAALEKLPKEQRQGRKIMSEQQVRRFISHYQRLTEHAIGSLPGKADWLLHLDENHRLTFRRGAKESARKEKT